MSKESAPPMENEHFQQVLYFFLNVINLYVFDRSAWSKLSSPPSFYLSKYNWFNWPNQQVFFHELADFWADMLRVHILKYSNDMLIFDNLFCKLYYHRVYGFID